jgi:hypothetical protein
LPFTLNDEHVALFAPPNPTATALTIDAAKGTFKGTFKLIDADALRPRQVIARSATCFGVLVPGRAEGLGFFTLPQLPDGTTPSPAATRILSGPLHLKAPGVSD